MLSTAAAQPKGFDRNGYLFVGVGDSDTGRGALPVTKRLSVFARVGLLAWETSARAALLNDSGTDLLYGLGLAADLNDRIYVQLSYEAADIDVDTVKLGLRMRL